MHAKPNLLIVVKRPIDIRHIEDCIKSHSKLFKDYEIEFDYYGTTLNTETFRPKLCKRDDNWFAGNKKLDLSSVKLKDVELPNDTYLMDLSEYGSTAMRVRYNDFPIDAIEKIVFLTWPDIRNDVTAECYVSAKKYIELTGFPSDMCFFANITSDQPKDLHEAFHNELPFSDVDEKYRKYFLTYK